MLGTLYGYCLDEITNKYLRNRVLKSVNCISSGVIQTITPFKKTEEFEELKQFAIKDKFGDKPLKNVVLFSKEYNDIMDYQKALDSYKPTKNDVIEYLIKDRGEYLLNCVAYPDNKIIKPSNTRTKKIKELAELIVLDFDTRKSTHSPFISNLLFLITTFKGTEFNGIEYIFQLKVKEALHKKEICLLDIPVIMNQANNILLITNKNNKEFVVKYNEVRNENFNMEVI